MGRSTGPQPGPQPGRGRGRSRPGPSLLTAALTSELNAPRPRAMTPDTRLYHLTRARARLFSAEDTGRIGWVRAMELRELRSPYAWPVSPTWRC